MPAGIDLPRPRFRHSIDGVDPTSPLQAWHAGGAASVDRNCAHPADLAALLRRATRFRAWRWPSRRIIFVTDPHADAGAFIASLAASGGVRVTGDGETGFELTPQGRKAVFVVGGDCLDKGPSNLGLLRALKHLMAISKRVKLLAGNHDMRLFLGLRGFGARDELLTEHLFVRMGVKCVPLLAEVCRDYRQEVDAALATTPVTEDCRRQLAPTEAWYEQFPRRAAGTLRPAALEKEVRRIRDKSARLETACAEAGMDLREVYATARVCHRLFLQRGGEFGWFFREMRLAYRAGSFLFVHAGIDDRLAKHLGRRSLKQINRKFRRELQRDPFGCYFGPMGNPMRTKYRDNNFPLTAAGVELFHRAGLHAVVHGHRNTHTGQRLMLRHGVLHIECDTTMDCNSRAKEGLPGQGIGVTIVESAGRVVGLSSDHYHPKVFAPDDYLRYAETRRHETESQAIPPRIPAGL